MKPGTVVDGRFEIASVAGQGGAGIVYRARDRDTGELVAIKIARAAGLDDPRFEREIAALAALRHPAIVRYCRHGTVDGAPYLAMEWLEGEDLGARLEQTGRLALAEAVAIARQVAGALAAAHEKGLVHRDVKPANAFLVDKQLDQVKLLDFGLARPAGAAALTATGMLVGTPSYMAPEQARGVRELDPRVDVYGLGALLFRCAAGQPPFPGYSVEGVIARIVGEPAPRLATLVDGVPAELDALVARMLSKDPLRRPADGRAAHAALVGLGAPAQPGPDEISITLEARSRTAAPPASSIGVLAFADMSPDRDHGYLCDGIAEELVDALGRIDGLRVASRIAIPPAIVADARAIGTRLGLDTMLEGGLRLAGNRLRVTVRLVDVATGDQRWSQRFDAMLDDVFAIQDEIALRVVEALRGMLRERDEQLMRRPGAHVEAYGYYLRARQLVHAMSPGAYGSAVELFERAIAIDPGYAPAYAGLAEMHCRYFEWSYGDDATRAAADRASLRALELAPQLVEAHVARAQVLATFGRHAEARSACTDAIRLQPTSFDAHHVCGRVCFEMGDIEAAVAMFRRASELRLDDYQGPLLLAQSLRRLGRLDDARGARRDGLDRVERQLALWPDDPRALSLGASELVHEDPERARAWAERAIASAPDDPGVWYNVACTYAGLHDKDAALAWLAKTFSLGIGMRAWVDRDPDFDFLRDDPRFRALVAELS